jgi:hypothetical protein
VHLLAKRLKEDYKVFMVTPRLDNWYRYCSYVPPQLHGNGIGFSNPEIQKRFGVERPEQVRQRKKGDASDNIPGFYQVQGDKTIKNTNMKYEGF